MLDALSVFLQVVFIDLVLAGDNAIVVGMVAARVAPELRQKVIFYGIAGAVVIRILFSMVTVQLLGVVGLKLFGGLLLLWVCWRLGSELIEAARGHAETEEASDPREQFSTLRPAVIQIVLADLSMSIDNVLAIAGVARAHPTILVFGLVLSVAFMVFAATFIAKILQRYPWVAWLGLALILYVAIVMSWEGAHELLALR